MAKKLCILAAALGFVISPLNAQDATAVLQKAQKAMGNVSSIQYAGNGYDFELGQNVRPTTPWTKLIVTRYTQTIDYTTRSSKEELTRINETPPVPGGGGLFAGEQKQVNLVSGDYAWNQPGDKPQPALLLLPAIEISTAKLRQLQIWLTPHGFLKTAMENHATAKQENGATVVSFKLDKFDVKGTIDGQNLLTKVDTWIPNAVLGDMIIETTYSGYKDFNGAKFPTHIVQRDGQYPVLDLNVSSVQPNAPLNLSVPDAVKNMQPPSDSVVETQKLADGVWYLTGAFVDSVVIEYPSFVTVLEAPLSEERSLAVIAEIKKLVPNKRIRYVLNTHHHFDHAAGLRTYAAEGATIITDEINVPFYQQANKAPRTLVPDKLSQNPVPVKFLPVKDKYVLLEGNRKLEIYHSEGETHDEGMLFAYLPKEKMLFEADEFTPPGPGAPPAGPGGSPYPPIVVGLHVSMYKNIQRLKLDVATIVPLHGVRTTKLDELIAGLH